MRNPWRRDPLERQLEARRATPRREFVDELSNSISAPQPASRRKFRTGLALAMTMAVLVVSASLGGVGYAESAMQQVATTVHHAAVKPKHVTVHHSMTPADWQYCHGKDCRHHHHHHHHHITTTITITTSRPRASAVVTARPTGS